MLARLFSIPAMIVAWDRKSSFTSVARPESTSMSMKPSYDDISRTYSTDQRYSLDAFGAGV
jgi:hypothetical protein